MAYGRTNGVIPRLKGRVAELRNRLSRARYFRGHGVHSPFVYDIVRNVFMSRELLHPNGELYGQLLSRGVAVRRAMELHNLMIHCGYKTVAICGADGVLPTLQADFCVVLGGLSMAQMVHIVRDAAQREATVAVIEPYADAQREGLCREIVAEHCSMTVDNRGYLLIFNNKRLPKQHYKI